MENLTGGAVSIPQGTVGAEPLLGGECLATLVARDVRKELFAGVVTGLIGDSGKALSMAEILDAAHAAVLRFDEIFGAPTT